MSYVIHNFQSLEKLYAEQLNEMDNQIATNEQEATDLKESLLQLDIKTSVIDDNVNNYVNNFISPSNIGYGEHLTLPLNAICNNKGYVKADGEIADSPIYTYAKIKSKGIYYIAITPTENKPVVPYVVRKNADGAYRAVIEGNITSRFRYIYFTPDDTETLYVNNFGSQYATEIEIVYRNDTNVIECVSKKDMETLSQIFTDNFCKLDFRKLSSPENYIYMNANGTTSGSNDHTCYHLPFRNIKKIKCDPAQNYVSIPTIIVKKDDAVVKTFAPTANNLVLDLNGVEYSDIYFNWYGAHATEKNYVNVIKLYRKTSKRYGHSVKKPLIFTGKTGVFCGDSITKGYINGTDITQNGYPALFSAHVGMSHTNLGVGGATIARVSGYGCIQDQVASANKNSDYIFISGGINDWQLGVSLANFESAIKNLINSLSTYNGHIVWITPINHGGRTPIVTPVAEVDDYREVINRTVMKYNTKLNMSIVQGDKFNFPDESDEAEYISVMYGDKLHPSQLGYNTLYLNGLCNALL